MVSMLTTSANGPNNGMPTGMANKLYDGKSTPQHSRLSDFLNIDGLGSSDNRHKAPGQPHQNQVHAKMPGYAQKPKGDAKANKAYRHRFKFILDSPCNTTNTPPRNDPTVQTISLAESRQTSFPKLRSAIKGVRIAAGVIRKNEMI